MRVLLVEDEQDLGAAIKRVLHQESYVVDWVVDGTIAWEYLESQLTLYRLAIFDWLLPGLSGLELVKLLRQKNSALPVLLLTAKDSMADKVMGLDAGADDYLVKPFGMAELLARLRALQRRSPQFQAQQLQVGNIILDYGTNTVCLMDKNQKKQVISLTHKEFVLLEYFLRHPHQILSRDQILAQLWELDAEPISNVVAAQIRLLRRKLSMSGGEDLIETVYGLGYRFNPVEK
ncbi:MULTISPECIES: two-component system response regulator RppA [unclassified Okeania]|uniref:two-component system response regulator RppA n=1 Tax=unclassified Okeania TaxID=2634635 RepID=UPI0013B887D6|nr:MULTISPECIES: two-component system response regulator RppA [unclassified Okeania]NES76171.1 response regulator transcription factor [Okeania sp. SIO1H4]NET13609.1 response regulator transcription factor [Okeania sp. SIO1H6]NET19615.1 response regulator transcription factor [Okeania sp. SIO1H5]NET93351.1 response regulator transcription factor [Okeania sp. SIO1H2]